HLPPNSRISFKEYTLLHRWAVVLDDVEQLTTDLKALNALLDYLSAAVVVLTSSTLVPAAHLAAYIRLSELDRDAVENMVVNSLHSQADDPTEAVTRIWESVGGNPMAVCLLLSQLDYRGHLNLAGGSIEKLFTKLYA